MVYKEGNIPWNKYNKSYVDDVFRKKCINKTIRYGKDNGFYGKKHSEETKQISSERMKLMWTDSLYRENLLKQWSVSKKTEEFREHCRLIRSKTIFPLIDSKPEKMVQLALSLEGIKYKKHQMIRAKNFYHSVDLFIEPNICIEIDGDYWHSIPKMVIRDMEVNEMLNSLGYIVIRISEKRVKDDAKIAFMNIIKLIKQNIISNSEEFIWYR